MQHTVRINARTCTINVMDSNVEHSGPERILNGHSVSAGE